MSYDLSKLFLNFETCPEGTPLTSHFSELGAFKEFTKCDDDRIKIAILSADVDSPFVRIKDRDAMVRAIFDFLGINAKKEAKLLEDVISYKDFKTTYAWLKYLQILNETDFTDLLLAKKDYEFFLSQSNEDKGKDETDIQYYKRRNETRERVKALGKEVKDIEAKIFPDSRAAREAAIAEARKKIKLYAEAYAEPFNYY